MLAAVSARLAVIASQTAFQGELAHAATHRAAADGRLACG